MGRMDRIRSDGFHQIEIGNVHPSKDHPYPHVDTYWYDDKGKRLGRKDGIPLSEIGYREGTSAEAMYN